MRFARLALQYLRKNYWYLILATLVPAIIMGLFTEPCTMIRLFTNFATTSFASFGDVFFAISELNWRSVGLGVFAVPLLCIFFSIVCGLESKHMRWGILSGEGLGKRINNNFLPVFKIVLVLICAMEFYAFVCTLFTFLWVKTIHNATVALGLTIFVNLVFFLILLSALIILSLTLPIMSITGVNMRKAMSKSAALMKGKYFKMLFAVIVPMIIPYVLMATFAALGYWWRKIINIFLFMYVIAYFITLMYTTYLDIEDIDREDLKNKYLKMVEE